LVSKTRDRVAPKGDFLVDGRLTFEIGGTGKDGEQIKGVENAWLALDNIDVGVGRRVSLWMFGFI
jgi:hypothetical protein